MSHRLGASDGRYTLAWLQLRLGDPDAAAEFRRAADMPPDYCFPARLEEIEILETAMAKQPEDARAPYYLGNLLYDRRRYEDAIAAWRRAAQLGPAFSTVHRNLGLAEFNVLGRPERALACYRRAFEADLSDARSSTSSTSCGAAVAMRQGNAYSCSTSTGSSWVSATTSPSST